ncbi:MAG: hypothetical protein A2Z88_05530 [Omnitrophica WOR_2 bacterium GWA2_47_8]|nr:MAG: hypothetical protein A2Z88_05530 [Omnitrophica WOR_2 bacterium GWA2_47_8]
MKKITCYFLGFVLYFGFCANVFAKSISAAPQPTNTSPVYNNPPSIVSPTGTVSIYVPPVDAVVSYTTFDLSGNVINLNFADINNQSGVIRKQPIDSVVITPQDDTFLGVPDTVLSPATNEINIVYPKRSAAGIPGIAVYAHKNIQNNNFSFETIPYPVLPPSGMVFDTDIVLTDPSTGSRVMVGALISNGLGTGSFSYYLAERQNSGNWIVQAIPLSLSGGVNFPPMRFDISYEKVNPATELIHIDYMRSPVNLPSSYEYVRQTVNISQPGWIVGTPQIQFTNFHIDLVQGPPPGYFPYFFLFLGQNNSGSQVSSFNIERLQNPGISGFYVKNFQSNSPPQLLAANGKAGSTALLDGTALTFNLVEEEGNNQRDLVYYLHDGISTIIRNVMLSIPNTTNSFYASIDQGRNTIALSFHRPISYSSQGQIFYKQIDSSGNVLHSHIVENCLSWGRSCTGPIQVRAVK